MTEREKFEKWFDDNVESFPFGSEAERNAYKRYADIVWQAANAQAVPEGWKLVPVEPTTQMARTANAKAKVKYLSLDGYKCIYKAMLEAAPDGDE